MVTERPRYSHRGGTKSDLDIFERSLCEPNHKPSKWIKQIGKIFFKRNIRLEQHSKLTGPNGYV